MDKDINNLEEIINLCKEEINNNDKNITATLDLEDLKSLKNLLTGYKELEEENARYEYKCEIMFNKLIEYSKTLEKLQKETICKSKVKEKLKKIKARTDCKYCNNTCDSYAVCKTLEELLEEGK